MKRYADLTREERVKKVMKQRRKDLALVLENLSEEQNISAILRSAEAFGIGLVCTVHLGGGRLKLSKNISSGAVKWLEVKRYKSIKTCVNVLKEKGFKIIGALVDPKAKVLWDQKFAGKVAVLVGNEARGLSKTAQKLVDKNVYLPMFGLTESLNVSVAAGIFIYEVIRQKEKVV